MNGEKYPEMWKVCIFIFTFSHGPNSVEGGFSVNKDSLEDNLDSSTLEAVHVCYDELVAYGNNIKSLKFPRN